MSRRVAPRHRDAASVVCALAVTVALVGSLTSCRASSRERAVAEFIEQLETEGGLPPELARCVADGFVEGRTTAELEAFFERPELTTEEADEFAALAEQCGVTSQPTEVSGQEP